jgi:beta-galactosidase
VAETPCKTIPVDGWRWKLAPVPQKTALLPEYANDFDDSAWNRIKPKTDGDTGSQVLSEGQTAVFRAHVTLTAADLAGQSVHIRFGGIDDHGWVFVNQQFVGDSSDWQAQPAFEAKSALHPGDNVIAVGVWNQTGAGGLNPDVNVELPSQTIALDWSRSLFNGLAQVIVQSTRVNGEFQLTATADGLKPATATVDTQSVPPPPEVP